MLNSFQCSGQGPKHHSLPKIALNPNPATASVYSCKQSEFSQVSPRRNERPLNSSKNVCHRRKVESNAMTPLVKLIRRRRKARPGTITEHAKLRRPINDWVSFKDTFLRRKKSERNVFGFRYLIINFGNRASIVFVSNSVPAKIKTV